MTTSNVAPVESAKQATVQYPKFRWAILITACLSVLAFQVTAMSYSPLLGEIGKNLGVSLAQSVNLMSFFMLFAAISFFIAGPFCDKFGVNTAITASAVLSAVPTAITFWAHSYAVVIVLRILQGSAVGFSLAGLAPLVSQWFPARQRGLALGISGACNPLGVFIGVLAAPALFRSTGSWQLTIAILSIAGWVTLLCCIVVFKIAKSRTPQAIHCNEEANVGDTFKAALRSRVTWVGVLLTFALNWIMQSAFGLSPSYFAEAKPVGLGFGLLVAGQLMGVVQIGAMVGPIVGGVLLDKVFDGKARGVLAIAYFLSLTYCMLQFGAVYNNRPLFVLFLLLSGAGIGMLFPLVQGQINELYNHQIVGRMNGVWLGIGAFGGSAGLFVNSIALRNTGNYVMSINIISIAAAVGLVLCILLKPSKTQQA